MIVCLCEGVNDREILSSIEDGSKNLVAIGRQCGAGTGCGHCHPELKRMLRESRRNTSFASLSARVTLAAVAVA